MGLVSDDSTPRDQKSRMGMLKVYGESWVRINRPKPALHVFLFRQAGDMGVQRRVMHHAILYGTKAPITGQEGETDNTRPPLDTVRWECFFKSP